MKKHVAITAQVLALALGMTGCLQQDDDFQKRRKPGFRSPQIPVSQQEIPPIDPPPTQPNNTANQTPPVNNTGTSPNTPDTTTKTNQPDPAPTNPQDTPPQTPKKPSAPPTAKRVPGKPHQIINPYTNAILDVTGVLPGTEVRDPRTHETMLVP